MKFQLLCYRSDLQIHTKFSHFGDLNEGNAAWKCWSSLPFVARFMFPVLRRQAVSQPRGVTALLIDTCKNYAATFINVFRSNPLKTRYCATCVTVFYGKVTVEVGVGCAADVRLLARTNIRHLRHHVPICRGASSASHHMIILLLPR
jgi:hypothetical protein